MFLPRQPGANEPAVFVAPTWTMPPEVRHDNEGLPTDHREIHNVYGMLMTRSTFEGLSRLPAGWPLVRLLERPALRGRAPDPCSGVAGVDPDVRA